MKYSINFFIYGQVYSKMISNRDFKKKKKDVLKEYKEIVKRAKPIGPKNPLESSYGLCAFFIAMNRCNDPSPEVNYLLLEDGFKNCPWVKPVLGNGNGYFDEKRMEGRRLWSKRTHEKKYENDWVVDIIEKADGPEGYEMGYDYLECGDCKMCCDEGCPELAKYLCKLDFLLVDIIGIGLKRTMTLAEGCSKCDFRFYKK